MRKIAVFALLISLVALGAVFAEDTQPAPAPAPAATTPAADAATTTPAPAAKPVEKTISGTVVSFTPADTAKKTPAKLVVKVGAKEETFLIGAKFALEGKDKKTAPLSALKAGVSVEVKFTDDAGTLTAFLVSLK